MPEHRINKALATKIFQNNEAFFSDPLTQQESFQGFYNSQGILPELALFSNEFKEFLYNKTTILESHDQGRGRIINAKKPLINYYRKKDFKTLLSNDDFCQFLVSHEHSFVICMYRIKDKPAQASKFKENYQKLATLGLTQSVYIEKVLENPGLISEFQANHGVFLKLATLGLTQSVYVDKVLENPGLISEFQANQDAFLELATLGLTQSVYIEKVLENPGLISEFQANHGVFLKLATLGLTQSVYVDKVLENPGLISEFQANQDAFLELATLGLTQSVCVDKVLDDPAKFRINLPKLKMTNTLIENTLNNIETNLAERSTRKTNFLSNKEQFKNNVMALCFCYSMDSENGKKEQFKKELEYHENYFLNKSHLNIDRSISSKYARRAMRFLIHLIPPVFIAGVIYGALKRRRSPTRTQCLFPFFNTTASVKKIEDTVTQIEHKLTPR